MNGDDQSNARPAVWVLADERPGNRSQALGVGDALGVPYRRMDIRYGGLARLPNWLLGARLSGVIEAGRAALTPPWPDLIIAAGRRTAPVARAVKRLSGGRSWLVQIMDPGAAGAADFGLIAMPAHDKSPDAANVMRITGAAHGLTPGVLKAAGEIWSARLDGLARPRIALVVGGATRRKKFTDGMAGELALLVNGLRAREAGSLMVTTSRRSGPAGETLLAALDAPDFVYRWDDAGDNPYRGMLALADAVVVTGESVSMLSEACAGGAPVLFYAPEALIGRKHARFHAALIAGGHARALNAGSTLAAAAPAAALNAAAEIAAAVRARCPLFGPD